MYDKYVHGVVGLNARTRFYNLKTRICSCFVAKIKMIMTLGSHQIIRGRMGEKLMLY